MADEEFHEIQLNGKQLVFLFMAGTVAAVVIFLCGLMVGRNLRVPRLEAAAATTEAVVGDPTRPQDATLPEPPTGGTINGAPVSTKEELTYNGRLEDPTPAEETLKPGDFPAKTVDRRDDKAASARSATAAEKAAPKPADKPTTTAVTKPIAAPEPAGNGWAVQVQAVNSQPEAEALARRLSGKGYPTFVTPRKVGNQIRYGVRVGKYDKKGDAEAVKARLEKEEQFKPWVTR
jgi:cell division septation protein DedD